MIIGVPAQAAECQVAITPDSVYELQVLGHQILAEAGAGTGSSLSDVGLAAAGATLVDAATAWSAELICKAKEPHESELPYPRPGLVLFTYLHVAAYHHVPKALLESESSAAAYETVQLTPGDPATRCADERSRGTHRYQVRSPLPRGIARSAAHPARWCPWCAASSRRDHRRWPCGLEVRVECPGYGGRGRAPRPRPHPATVGRSDPPRPGHDTRAESRVHQAHDIRRGSGHQSGVRSRRQGPHRHHGRNESPEYAPGRLLGAKVLSPQTRGTSR